MKKILCYALLTGILLFSLTGCLKDDYQAIIEEIEEVKEDIYVIEDNIDEISSLIASSEASICAINEDIAALEAQSEALDAEIAIMETVLETTSDTGLGITKFQFEKAFDALIVEDDIFSNLNISIDSQYINEDSEIVLSYVLLVGEEYTDLFTYHLILAPDLIHIKQITLMCDYDYAVENEEYYYKYITTMLMAFVMVKEDCYDSQDLDEEIFEELADLEKVYDDTVQVETDSEDGNFYVHIKDIS